MSHRSGRPALAVLLLACIVWPAHVQAKQVHDAASKKSGTQVEQSQLIPTERMQSQQWGLSETEWRRYETIMQGIRGRLSPNISPIEALGIHAQTEEERRRYAKLWAKALREDTERVLAFQRAYDDAWKRLYGNEPLIDLSLLPRARQNALLQAGDRILLFTRASCAACDKTLKTLLATLQRTPKLGLDIYLVDSGNDAATVRAWAKAHNIPPQLVSGRRVTLNHDNGALARLSGFTGSVPYLARRRGGQLIRIESHMVELP